MIIFLVYVVTYPIVLKYLTSKLVHQVQYKEPTTSTLTEINPIVSLIVKTNVFVGWGEIYNISSITHTDKNQSQIASESVEISRHKFANL